MFLTIILTLLFCGLVTAAMAVFLFMIPKFGATHFGAPEDIQKMVKKMPDLPKWKVFLRFVVMLEGYKLYDIFFFDYLMLTKMQCVLIGIKSGYLMRNSRELT